MFRIEDELHDESFGQDFETMDAVLAELRRLAAIPWDQEPNCAPCMNWRNCGRHYEITEYNADDPVPEIRRFLTLEISAAGVKWTELLDRPKS
jgi:hypothetical protein